MAALFSKLYDLLHDIASRQMSGQRDSHTLQPTALLNEAYLRMSRGADSQFQDQAHFLRTAAKAMRSALVDHARLKQRLKRNGGVAPISLDSVQIAFESRAIDLLQLHEALDQLSLQDPNLTTVVELRFFAGCTIREIAETMGVSERTTERAWHYARTLLHSLINGDRDDGDGSPDAPSSAC